MNILEQFLLTDEGKKIKGKQRKVLEAAVEMFASYGYAGTSTEQIAHVAGVSEATVLKYFKGKDTLLHTIVSPSIARYLGPFAIRQFKKEIFTRDYDSLREFLREIIKNRYTFTKKNVHIVHVIVQEVVTNEKLQKEMKELFAEEMFPIIEKLFQKFRNKGEMGTISTWGALPLIFAPIEAMFAMMFVIFPEKKWDVEKEIEQTVQFIERGLKG